MAINNNEARREFVTSGPAGRRLVFLHDVPDQVDVTGGQVADVLRDRILDASEARGLLSRLALSPTEHGKKMLITQIAKSNGVTYEDLLAELRTHARENIRAREKGNLRHYHRTSFERFQSVVGYGGLMSRSVLREKHPEIDLPGWSASDSVMMGRDKFDSNGKVLAKGIDTVENAGASGKGVIFVFKEDLMNLSGYDAMGEYPTIDDLPLKGYCEAVLVYNGEDARKARRLLDDAGLTDVKVSMKDAWV